jgi:hypothetical protein
MNSQRKPRSAIGKYLFLLLAALAIHNSVTAEALDTGTHAAQCKVDECQACMACGGDCDACGGERTIWVDQQAGDDANSGLSRDQALKTISQGAQVVRGGDVMIVRPGTYYETPEFQDLGSSASAPVWILAEIPGNAVISSLWQAAAEGTQAWEHQGNGV